MDGDDDEIVCKNPIDEKRKRKPSIGTLIQTIAVPIPASHRILESGASSE